MNVTITHTRAIVGWNITVSVTAGDKETIAHVQTLVNGFSQDDQDVDPPAKSWSNELKQQGDYPEENTAEVTVTDGDGGTTTWDSKWS
jgi:hypothetical protein